MRQEFSKWFDWVAAAATTLLLIFSFPNFEFWFLAWIGLVPLLVAIARRPSPRRALLLGWAAGTVFFYATCYWLTYSMIHYGGVPTIIAYVLLLPGAIVVGLFPALAMMLAALAIKRWGVWAVLLAPIFWTAFEWFRLGVTGQLWNALGYSQAFKSALIQPASWGGVYAVSFLIVLINAAIVLAVMRRTVRSIAAAAVAVIAVVLVVWQSRVQPLPRLTSDPVMSLCVVAVQPNVPMTMVKTTEEMKQLLERHLSLSTNALKQCVASNERNLVIWPESPMNFTYGSDRSFQELVTRFSLENNTSLLFNSLEPVPGGGSYNSAVLINGNAPITQYDKIRLMPFGEYVPLPQWLPGASLITGIVGEFTPGEKYTLMGVGNYRAGVFICIESAYPWIARTMTSEGANLLINISNDGYLGPTAVMRQHLANAIFRAVENGRPLLRVTNTGISAEITPRGEIKDQTGAFEHDVRVWRYSPLEASTSYTKHGDRFVQLCAAIALILLVVMLLDQRRSFRKLR
ncbi:MAG TPA: apolipoprotein N-acyltransferase [Pyrinomonadaceae bacterium]|nr:apolipoprotein N-acyltransferase [Pyrinomonadaceae bacterium]